MTRKELIHKLGGYALGAVGLADYLIAQGIVTVEPERTRGEVLAADYTYPMTSGVVGMGVDGVKLGSFPDISLDRLRSILADIIDDVLAREEEARQSAPSAIRAVLGGCKA